MPVLPRGDVGNEPLLGGASAVLAAEGDVQASFLGRVDRRTGPGSDLALDEAGSSRTCHSEVGIENITLSTRVRRQHVAVHDLITQGKGLHSIAQELGLARNTVRRLAHVSTPDELLVEQ